MLNILISCGHVINIFWENMCLILGSILFYESPEDSKILHLELIKNEKVYAIVYLYQ